jgi:two-component system LytT family sensor kinase
MTAFRTRENILKHVTFWLALTLYLCLFDPVRGALPVQTIGTFLIIIRYVFIYYAEYLFVFPKFYEKKLMLVAGLVSVFLLYFVSSYFIYVYYFGIYSPVVISYDIKRLLISNTVLFSVISVMALGTYQKKTAIRKLLKQSKREQALIFKELGFFKNQFNSHVTFNFLNYCYSKIHLDSQETAEAIETFSTMLRYSLNNKEDEKVLLKHEIEYIENFISLQKLLSSDVNIQFKVGEHVNTNLYILPRILIVFVENAFKHGNIYSTKIPIKIELDFSNDKLIFKVTNEKNKEQLKEVSGIGYYNLKQQLDMFYKERHWLEIEQDDLIYSSKLMIHS